MDAPNTVSGLLTKRADLVRYRDQLEADIKAATCDIDHLEAAIRIFDPEDSPTARRRYAAMHRAPKGQSTPFVLSQLREASGSLTSRGLAEAWCADRGLTAKEATLSMLRKRLGATLTALKGKGLVVQEGHQGGHIAWRLA
jgi:hypothetical protein